MPCEEELKFFYLIVGDTKAIEDAVMLITLTEQMQITYVRIDALTLTKKMLSDWIWSLFSTYPLLKLSYSYFIKVLFLKFEDFFIHVIMNKIGSYSSSHLKIPLQNKY